MPAHSICEGDAGWCQPAARWPDMHPLMSDLARCFRQPFSRALAALLAEVDGIVQPGERAQRSALCRAEKLGARVFMTRHPWILFAACPCCTATFWPCGTPPSLSPTNSRPMLVQAAHARVILLDHVSARSPTVMSSQCRGQSRREFHHRDVFAAPPQRTHSALSHLSARFSMHLFFARGLQCTSPSPFHVAHAGRVFALHAVTKNIGARAS